jgi:pSer/pThr/pTyr-binding forkhead associated (FHA) protein
VVSQDWQIQLSWQDPETGEPQSFSSTSAIALGRDWSQLPAEYQGKSVTRIVLSNTQVSRFHALIQVAQGQAQIFDQNSSNGLQVNGVPQRVCTLNTGDRIQIGAYQLTVTLTPVAAVPPAMPPRQDSVIRVPDPVVAEEPVHSFPPPCFQSRQVEVQALYATGLPVEEMEYAAVGAGMGSFVWVDCMRLSGARVDQIRALGLEDKPYARYQRLCRNSQIPPHERLRSNSDSCPDNIWGWPSYALRESWASLQKGQLAEVFRRLWQVFAEPVFAETYTPRSGNVFASIDREAARIGWSQIYKFGRVRSIRQTQDGRYAIAYSQGRGQHALLIARYVQIATGYPVIQFLPDLKQYRSQYNDFQSVVNAYEEHHHVYQYLEQHGGAVVLRGRGIVASRILQRLFEARKRNPNISVLHLMRSPKPKGNVYGKSQRPVKNHFELQPFNWPKACWGGTLREDLEKADPEVRSQLLDHWGGTTTADRVDWQRIVQQGINEGWYQITFGEVIRVEPDGQGHPVTYIQGSQLQGEIKLEANFIIDATGLDGKVKADPFLADLVDHYSLPLNPKQRLTVANDFELLELRNQQGRIYGAGAITFGGPHAAVDSFLGLQYCALQAVDGIVKARAPGMKRLNGFRSLGQWLRWVNNQAP